MMLGAVAICWGLVCGYLLLRGLDSFLGLVFCVHGIFARRWKILANKNAIGLIRPDLILKLGLRLAIYLVLVGFLLDMGHDFVRRVYHFRYAEGHGLLFASAVTAMFGVGLGRSWRRLKLVWAMSHKFDFAERLERTRRLKS
jgi:hypothetical protein